MSSQSLEELQNAVEQLFKLHQDLQTRNERLTNTHELWLAERRKLLRRFEQVDKYLDSSLSRLESIKPNTES